MNDVTAAMVIIVVAFLIVFAGVLAGEHLGKNSTLKVIVGYTEEELFQMKRECEKDLLRGKSCTITVKYVEEE